MTETVQNIARLQRMLTDIQSGKFVPPKRIVGPSQAYRETVLVPQLTKFKSKRWFNSRAGKISDMTFNLVEQDGNQLVYKADCPRCGAHEAIQADTVLQYGSTVWPPASGYAQLCLDCEDSLDDLMEGKK